MTEVSATDVIARLQAKIGQTAVQHAMLEVQVESLTARVAELEALVPDELEMSHGLG